MSSHVCNLRVLWRNLVRGPCNAIHTEWQVYERQRYMRGGDGKRKMREKQGIEGPRDEDGKRR